MTLMALLALSTAAPQVLLSHKLLAPLSYQTPADTVPAVHIAAYAVPLAYHALPATYTYPHANLVSAYLNINKIKLKNYNDHNLISDPVSEELIRSLC